MNPRSCAAATAATVHAFPQAPRNISASAAPARRCHRTLAEVPGFLRALRDARETWPNVARAAWVAAGRATVRTLRHVNAATVHAYALDALRRLNGRDAA